MEDDNNVIVCLQTYPARWLRMCSCRTCLWRWPRSGSHLRLHPPLWWCSSRKCRSDRERENEREREGIDDELGTHTIRCTPVNMRTYGYRYAVCAHRRAHTAADRYWLSQFVWSHTIDCLIFQNVHFFAIQCDFNYTNLHSHTQTQNEMAERRICFFCWVQNCQYWSWSHCVMVKETTG